MKPKSYTSFKEPCIYGNTFKWLPHLFQIIYVGAFVFTGKNTYVGYIDNLFCIGIFFFFMGMSYLITYYFMPKFLFKKKYFIYFALILGIVVISTFLFKYIQDVLQPYSINKNSNVPHTTWAIKIFWTSLIYIIFLGPFTFWKMLLQWTKDNNKINELENATIQSELQQLKNQINPHFLFNMLNNANVLIRKDPEKASETLLGLSELIRYQLYESSRPKVLLASDIKALKDFLNLEKLRRDDFDYSINVIGEVNTVFLPPLLFIPFVENATKHNLDSEKTAFIHIFFDIQDNYLYFSCINSKPRKAVPKSAHGGLGLNNSNRRLKLLYDNRYQLDIRDEKETFTVNLKIPV